MPFTAATAFSFRGCPWSIVLFMAEAFGAIRAGLTVMTAGVDVADRGGLALSVTLTYSVWVPETATYA